MQLVGAQRFEPKRVFRCLRCDPPPKKLRVARRYLFVIEDDRGEGSEYCLPCAAKLLQVRQGVLVKTAAYSGEIRGD